MTEVNSCFIRKCGPNHEVDVERVSSSQPGEELISWNDAIEMVVKYKSWRFSKQKFHFSNSSHVDNLAHRQAYTFHGNINTFQFWILMQLHLILFMVQKIMTILCVLIFNLLERGEKAHLCESVLDYIKPHLYFKCTVFKPGIKKKLYLQII